MITKYMAQALKTNSEPYKKFSLIVGRNFINEESDRTTNEFLIVPVEWFKKYLESAERPWWASKSAWEDFILVEVLKNAQSEMNVIWLSDEDYKVATELQKELLVWDAEEIKQRGIAWEEARQTREEISIVKEA